MLTFAAPAAAWLFALLLPLAAFYFLKLRRPRQEVSSLALWRQVLNDQRVNSPFQRFKRNLLLLLQLLLMVALAFAAMQPAVRRGPAQARRLPILIDCSASMAALDRAGGSARLDVAKQRVRELIDHLLPDQEICLIAFAKAAHKLTDFTNDQRLLRAALEAIRPEDVPGDMEDVLRLAQAQARIAPFEAALVLSDGNFPAQTNFELSFKVEYQRLPPGGPNLGIVACNARRSAAEAKWDVFVEIAGSAGAGEGASVELVRDGAVIGVERLTASAANGKPSARLNFSVEGSQAAALRVRLIPDGFDALAADNAAYLDLPPARSLNVYVAPPLAVWRHAFQSLDGIRLFPLEEANADKTPPPARYDLAVTERPDALPAETGMLCTVGFVPPELSKLVAVEEGASGIVDWRRESPLLQHVELTDLVLSERPVTKDGAAEGDFQNLGYEILAQGNRGPLILEKGRGEQRPSVCLLFHANRSTLPYRLGFPIFVANLAQAAMKQHHLSEADAVHTGMLPALDLEPQRNYQVRGPKETRQSARSDEQGVLSGVPASYAGEYRIMEGNTQRALIGASLLSAAETELDSADAIQFNENLSATASMTEVKTDYPIWFPLTLLAFALLLVEWWYFQRRPARLPTAGIRP